MKTRIAVSIIVGFFCWNVLAQSANQDVTNGLNFLAAEDLTDANAQFTNALVLSPTNEAANALAAATRLLLLPTQPAGSNFLNSLGFSGSGRNIYDWTSTLPVDINGNTVVPTNNTLALIAFYRTNILAALGASQTNLAAITDTDFNLSLTSGETSLQAVTLLSLIHIFRALTSPATGCCSRSRIIMRRIATRMSATKFTSILSAAKSSSSICLSATRRSATVSANASPGTFFKVRWRPSTAARSRRTRSFMSRKPTTSSAATRR